MNDGLEISISVNDYSKKTVDEKLDILYQVSLKQQRFCDITTKSFGDRITSIETGRKLSKAKVAGIGIGSGGGAAALFSALKAFLSGD